MKGFSKESKAIEKWFYKNYDGIKFSIMMFEESVEYPCPIFECRFQLGNVIAVWKSGVKQYEFDYSTIKHIYEGDIKKVKDVIVDAVNWIITKHPEYTEKIMKVKK